MAYAIALSTDKKLKFNIELPADIKQTQQIVVPQIEKVEEPIKIIEPIIDAPKLIEEPVQEIPLAEPVQEMPLAEEI
jgi:hypothetical protein